jgi:predicted  nucleic acid-binding Zn-ribbon protein
MYHLQYPIGEYQEKKNLNQEEINRLINKLGEAPAQLKEAVAGLDEEQLDTPYRPNGWTVRQVVHHLPDSHMNGYIRFKL